MDEEAVILHGELHRRHKMILTSERILFVAFCLLFFGEVLVFCTVSAMQNILVRLPSAKT